MRAVPGCDGQPPGLSGGVVNTRQSLFAEFYALCLNATQAALDAGYSPKTAYSQGQRLLKKVEIQDIVSNKQIEKLAANNITAERILEEYRRLAFNDITDMIQIRPGVVLIKSTDELTPDQRAAIASIKQTDKGMIEVKFYDKTKALDALAKYRGLFSDSNTGQNTGGGAPQIIMQFNTKVETIVEAEDG